MPFFLHAAFYFIYLALGDRPDALLGQSIFDILDQSGTIQQHSLKNDTPSSLFMRSQQYV